MRRLRVLSEHPNLGRPSEIREGFEGAQAYVDAGLAEWVVDRIELVETAMMQPAVETATARPPARRGRPPRVSRTG